MNNCKTCKWWQDVRGMYQDQDKGICDLADVRKALGLEKMWDILWIHSDFGCIYWEAADDA